MIAIRKSTPVKGLVGIVLVLIVVLCLTGCIETASFSKNLNSEINTYGLHVAKSNDWKDNSDDGYISLKPIKDVEITGEVLSYDEFGNNILSYLENRYHGTYEIYDTEVNNGVVFYRISGETDHAYDAFLVGTDEDSVGFVIEFVLYGDKITSKNKEVIGEFFDEVEFNPVKANAAIIEELTGIDLTRDPEFDRLAMENANASAV